MKKTKKVLASLAIAGMVTSAIPFNALADVSATRIFGNDRIQTAINVAQAGWATGAATVIVAPSADANLVDALAAAPLAGQDNAPILLTAGSALDPNTKQEIISLKATKVIAVGALSDQVIADLNTISGVSVQQLKGTDRIDTAKKISAQLTAPAGTFVVGYGALADALSVASYAAANKYEILVANPDGSLPSSEVPVGTEYVIGGPSLVNDGAVPGATRIYGIDRYDTNNQVIQKLGSSFDKVFVANGENAHLVDSLVASAYAAQSKSVIALTDNSTVKATNYLGTKMTDSSTTIALGGTGVVSESVRSSVKAGGTVTPPTGNVTAMVTPGTGRSVAKGEALIKVATVNLSGNGTVTGMKVTRSGLSKDTDISGITVYDGDTRLNISAVVGNNVADFGFTNPLTVNGSKSLDVFMTLANDATTSSQIAMTVTEVKGATVTPTTSGVFTVADVSLGRLVPSMQAANPTNNLDPNGQSQLLHKYRFEATNEPIKMNKLTLTQLGSAGTGDIQDLELWANGAKIAGPVQQSSDRTVTFTLDQTIDQGGRLDVDLMGKVLSGSGRTVEYQIANNVDVRATGLTYGTTVVASANVGNFTTLTPDARTINPGSLTISRDTTSPVAATISNNVKDYDFGIFNVQATGEPIQLRTIDIKATATGAGSLSTIDNLKIYAGDNIIGSDVNAFRTATAAGSQTISVPLSNPITVTPGTPVLIKVTAELKDNIANINGGDAGILFGAGDTIQMSLAAVSSFARLTSGTTDGTAALDVAGNIMTIGNTGITATFVPKSNIKAYQNETSLVVGEFDLKHNLSESVLVNSIPFKMSTGYDPATAQAAANTAAVTAGDAVAGSVHAQVVAGAAAAAASAAGGGNLAANTAAALLAIDGAGGAGPLDAQEAAAIGTAATNAITTATSHGWADLSNVKLTDATGNVLSEIEATPTGTGDLRLYLNSPLKIDPNTTVRIRLVADVKSSAPNGATIHVGIGGAAGSALSATTAVTGNDVTLVGGADLAAAGSPQVLVTTAGALITAPTVSTNMDITDPATVGTTAKDVKVAGYTLSNSGSEPALLKKITVSVDNGGAGTLLPNQKFSNIRIVDASGNVLGSTAAIPGSQNYVTIDLDKPLELKDGSNNTKDIAIVADFNATSSEYGDNIRFMIGSLLADNDIEATTEFTGVACNLAASAPIFYANQSVFTVVPTTINVAAASISNPVAVGSTAGDAMVAGQEIARFNLTNNGTEAISLDTVQLNDQLSPAATPLGKVATAKVTLFDGDGVAISAETAWDAVAGDSLQVPLNSDLRIKPGETKVVSVKVTTATGLILGSTFQIRLEKVGTFYETAGNAFGGAGAGAGAGDNFTVNDNSTAPQVRVAAP